LENNPDEKGLRMGKVKLRQEDIMKKKTKTTTKKKVPGLGGKMTPPHLKITIPTNNWRVMGGWSKNSGDSKGVDGKIWFGLGEWGLQLLRQQVKNPMKCPRGCAMKFKKSWQT